MDAAHPDIRIAEIASRQQGVVSKRQLLASGVSEKVIRQRLAIQRLRRIHSGVYATGHAPLSLHGRYLGAVLACGPGAVLSHRAAASALDLRPPGSGPIDVTVTRRGTRRQAGIAIHSTRSLHPTEITLREGIRITTPARTLVDLAAVLSSRDLGRVVERSVILRLFDGAALDAALARSNGRRGIGALRRVLAGLDDEPPLTRSELERRFLELIREAGIPTPVTNGWVAGLEVDFHWPAQRLVVEADGRAFHATAAGFERDRRRDLDLSLAGWHVLRVGWRQVVDDPGRLGALLRARLQPEPISQPATVRADVGTFPGVIGTMT